MADRRYQLHVIAQQEYVAGFLVTYTAQMYKIVGILATILFALTFLAIACGWGYVIDNNNKRKQNRAAVAASRATHNAIVGYVCHELRNPLHVVETWVQVMLQQFASNGRGSLFSPSPSSFTSDAVPVLVTGDSDDTDWQQVAEDVHAALLQMRNTVDDVLDFRMVRALKNARCSCFRTI
jgi:signal transduction histidine kinase